MTAAMDAPVRDFVDMVLCQVTFRGRTARI